MIYTRKSNSSLSEFKSTVENHSFSHYQYVIRSADSLSCESPLLDSLDLNYDTINHWLTVEDKNGVFLTLTEELSCTKSLKSEPYTDEYILFHFSNTGSSIYFRLYTQTLHLKHQDFKNVLSKNYFSYTLTVLQNKTIIKMFHGQTFRFSDVCPLSIYTQKNTNYYYDSCFLAYT